MMGGISACSRVTMLSNANFPVYTRWDHPATKYIVSHNTRSDRSVIHNSIGVIMRVYITLAKAVEASTTGTNKQTTRKQLKKLLLN